MGLARRCPRWCTGLVLALALALPAAPSPPARSAEAVPPAPGGLAAVEAELSLMLERYARPLEPAALLEAGWRGALQAARLPIAAPSGADPLPEERAAAWAEFRRRFALLVAAGGDAAGAAAEIPDPRAVAQEDTNV
jgi:hypothetical protein